MITKKFFCLCFFILSGQSIFSLDEGFGKLDWLEINERMNSDYWATELRENGREMVISPAWKRSSQELSKKILGLLPKKSSSYVTAVNVLLNTLRKEKIYATIKVYNFSGKSKLAKNRVLEAEETGVDFIFSMGSATAQFFFQEYRDTKLPVVASITKDPVTLGWVESYEAGNGSNIAGTSLNVHPKILTSYILEMVPHLKNVVLLYEDEHTQVKKTEVEPLFANFKSNRKNKKISVLRLVVEDRKKAYQILEAKLPPMVAELEKSDPSLLKSIFLITSSTTVFSNIELINRYSKNIPVISLVPDIVTEGKNSALIAIGIDRRNNAQIASDYAVDILKGKAKPQDMPVGIVYPPDVAINFLIAKKINIKIPFRLFEGAGFIYDYDGKTVRAFGEKVDKEAHYFFDSRPAVQVIPKKF